MKNEIVKTYPRDDGEMVVVHWQAEPGFPTWEMVFYVAQGRIEFQHACWAGDDGGTVEYPPSSPVRKAAHALVRRTMRQR